VRHRQDTHCPRSRPDSLTEGPIGRLHDGGGLIEAHDEKRLLPLQRLLATYERLAIDELGYVPLSQIGAELLFDVFRQRLALFRYLPTPRPPS
jgi:hypothetical protein